jgi:hypothetical protein
MIGDTDSVPEGFAGEQLSLITIGVCWRRLFRNVILGIFQKKEL